MTVRKIGATEIGNSAFGCVSKRFRLGYHGDRPASRWRDGFNKSGETLGQEFAASPAVLTI